MYKVLLFGATNVGKSRIYNRFSCSSSRIVSSCLNSTRDYDEAPIWENNNGELVYLLDAAGIGDNPTIAGELAICKSLSLIEQVDLVLFVLDGKKQALTALDYENIDKIRKFAKKSLLIINKCESRCNLDDKALFSLGIGEPIFISAEHNIGFELFKTKIEEKLGFGLLNAEYKNVKKLKLSILGRPNAGKSTLFNKIIGFERSIVCEENGTTRDSIAYEITHAGDKIILLDTAGIRKTYKRASEEVEDYSANIALACAKRSNVCIMLIDGSEGINQQDLYIVRKIIDAKKGLVVVINKCDLIGPEQKEEIEWAIRYKIREVSLIPILFVSSIYDNNFHCIIEEAKGVFEQMNRKISTSALNKWLSSATAKHKPAVMPQSKIPMKAKYITQVDGSIPSFKLFVNSTALVDKNYMKYLSNSLRSYFQLSSSPIDIMISSSSNPYSKSANHTFKTKRK